MEYELTIYQWNQDKNELLKQERNITFEEIVFAIKNGGLLDRLKHPNELKYPNQFIFHVAFEGYVYTVPFIQQKNICFLKTIFPDRVATKKYLGEKND